MATLGEMFVTLKVNTDEFIYSLKTADAAFTRMDRALWPTLPRWRRLWRTLQRKGW